MIFHVQLAAKVISKREKIHEMTNLIPSLFTAQAKKKRKENREKKKRKQREREKKERLIKHTRLTPTLQPHQQNNKKHRAKYKNNKEEKCFIGNTKMITAQQQVSVCISQFGVPAVHIYCRTNVL